ncbi:hypothetical protein GH890_24560 [Bacillus thuringiensis]|nr:hypothetical protein [Bacillus thuringiensis]
MVKHFDTQPKGLRREASSGLIPEVFSNLNIQGIPDKDIGIMYNLSPSFVTCGLLYFGFRAEESKEADIQRKECRK